MTNLFPGFFSIQKDTLERVVRKANAFLEPFGYTLDAEPRPDRDGRLGEYEMGSVFEKDIRVAVYPLPIRRYVTGQTVSDREWDLVKAGRPVRYNLENNFYMLCVLLQTELTVWHELGHALVEQVIDWMESLDDFNQVVGPDLLQKFHNVIDDETPEETLVEDFAWGMTRENGRSELKECFEEFFEKLTR